jgi:hypothetical protein
MQRLGVQWKMSSMMAATAIAAAVSSAVFSQDAISAGLSLIGTCILVLACKRTSDVVTLRAQHGLTTDGREKARLFLASSAVAAAIVLPSDLAFLAGFKAWMYLPSLQIFGPWRDLEDVAYATVPGTVLAVLTASGLRRALWPLGLTASERRRRLFAWSPGVLAACAAALVLLIGPHVYLYWYWYWY